MSTGKQGGGEELSPIQKAFEFADKLNYFFNRGPGYSEGINDTLLRELGVEKYKKFCKNLREANNGTLESPGFFKEDYANNPLRQEDVITDDQVKTVWKGLFKITKEVMKLL
jgi:hypothetical protein